VLRYALTDTLCLVRSLYFLIFSVAFSAGFYLMFTTVADQGNGDPGYPTAYMVAMAVSGAFFGALNGAGIRLGLERGDGWTRQVLLTPLTPVRYLGAKAITAWLATLPAILVVFALGATVNGVSLPNARWLAVIGICWLGSVVFVAIGVLVGVVATGEVVQFVALAIFFPFAMIGGLWFPTDTFPAGLRSLGAALPTAAIRELATAVATGQPAPLGDGRPVVVLGAWAVLATAVAVGLAGRVVGSGRSAPLVRRRPLVDAARRQPDGGSAGSAI